MVMIALFVTTNNTTMKTLMMVINHVHEDRDDHCSASGSEYC